MGLKDIWRRLTGKTDSTEIIADGKTDIPALASEAFPVVKMRAEQLEAYEKMPLASLAAYSSALSKLPESARTITTTVGTNGETFYRAINPKGVTGVRQYGTYGYTGNITDPKGTIIGREQYAPVTDMTSSTVLPFDPTLAVIAVALMSIEQKLDGIQKSVEEVLQFLKQEKQSKQRGNLNMLAEILEDYKLNCHDRQFCLSRIGEVLSIKTSAYQDIDFYQNQIAAELQRQKGLHSSKDARHLLDAVSYQFAEYRLACHLYAFASFLDIMLQRAFDKDSIENATRKIEDMTQRYRALYADCHIQIAEYRRSAIGSKMMIGIGAATKGLGKAIGAIPLIKEGQVDETLIDMGESIGQRNEESAQKELQLFEVLEDDGASSFIVDLHSVDQLFNTENAVLTDGENIYFLKPTQS